MEAKLQYVLYLFFVLLEFLQKYSLQLEVPAHPEKWQVSSSKIFWIAKKLRMYSQQGVLLALKQENRRLIIAMCLYIWSNFLFPTSHQSQNVVSGCFVIKQCTDTIGNVYIYVAMAIHKEQQDWTPYRGVWCQMEATSFWELHEYTVVHIIPLSSMFFSKHWKFQKDFPWDFLV